MISLRFAALILALFCIFVVQNVFAEDEKKDENFLEELQKSISKAMNDLKNNEQFQDLAKRAEEIGQSLKKKAEELSADVQKQVGGS